ncbi:MAG: T9SS type A sorting domain-containing protein [Chlorobi bacterium]|nr:T9SS type A sorting domain-containing protein [Chlorobiota bacterium]
MKNLLSVLLISLFVIPNSSLVYSQEIKQCGINKFDQQAIKEDPSILVKRAELEKFTKEFIKNNNRNKDRDIFVIPVVFHVVHDWGPENITKAKIEACIEQMNKDYSATNSDIDDVIPEFQNIIGTANVEFRLAKIDPDGNCTEGITRTASKYTYEASNAVKSVVPGWNPTMYLNIWTVHDIPGGTAAWSHYPGITPYLDGIVSEYSYIGTSGAGRHTIPHEAGHWMNLMHPWGSTNEPNVAVNCNYDDDVEDTPNTIGSAVGACNLSQNTCGSLDNVQNIMDYSGCDRMFTQGQVDRMQAALNSSISGRNNLWTSANLIATGTNDGYSGQPCAPIAEFNPDNKQTCDGSTIVYTDLSYNSEINNYNWSFPGGDPATSTDSIVSVVYNTPGVYNASLTVSNDYGENTITKSNLINIIDTYAGYNLPAHEDFEDTSFPLNSNDTTKSWTIEANGSTSWLYTSDAAANGTGSVRIKNNLIEDETINSLISPNINIRNNKIESLKFKLAFAKKSDESTGELRVFVSDNCGETWKLGYAKSGTSLTTNNGEVVTGAFIPNADQWREENVTISSVANADHIMIKFQNKSVGGNYLYIDDVVVDYVQNATDLNNKLLTNISIYPNPFIEKATISFQLLKPETVKIEVFTIMGKTIGSYEANYINGEHQINLSKIAPVVSSGVYFVKITTRDNTKSQRFIKL